MASNILRSDQLFFCQFLTKKFLQDEKLLNLNQSSFFQSNSCISPIVSIPYNIFNYFNHNLPFEVSAKFQV